jgi:Tfp pilus assembly protein PilV
MKARSRKTARGTSLIEAMIAMAVLLIGMAGFAALQVISVRSNHFAKRISMASALATDVTEHVARMPYNDANLNPWMTISAAGCTSNNLTPCIGDGVGDSNLLQRWETGTAQALPAYYTSGTYFSDATLGSGWHGLPVTTGGAGCSPPSVAGYDIDRDSCPDFFRYYSVYSIDPGNTGIPAGKLVQVVVRWKEPAFGYRQVTSTAFKFNPAVVVQ